MGDSITEGVVESYVKSKCRQISLDSFHIIYCVFSNASCFFYCCVDVGEFVKADEVVARIETDKVTVDILS